MAERTDLASALQRLTPVSPGMSLYEVITASRINDIQNAIWGLASGQNLRRGRGLLRREGAGWFQLLLEGAAGNTVGAQIDNGPFDFISLTGAGLLSIYPGTINQLLPSNPLNTIDCSGGATTYIKLHCETDSNQVNSAAYMADSTAPVPPVASKGAPPTSFDVLLGFITKTTVGPNTTYTRYKVWPHAMNIVATPVVWIMTDRSSPAPNQTLQETWYSWDIAPIAPA